MPALRLKGDGWEEKDFLSLSSNVGLVYKNNSERLNDQEEKKRMDVLTKGFLLFLHPEMRL